ncbi:hypothetical protein C8F01DRAFT_1000146, partial [Mycena amicta]
VRMQEYRKVIDSLELLVVQWLLELTKINQSGTGIYYPLKVPFKPVKNTIERYNKVAEVMTPPCQRLSRDVIVEYVFLSDFDLLRDDANPLENEKWATPTFRLLMDHYFKLERAWEEIQHLNIEIHRVITWIRDENRRLRQLTAELRTSGNIPLAVQVEMYCQRRSIFDGVHLQRFRKLARKQGAAFTGTLQAGVALNTDMSGVSMDVDDMAEPADLQEGVTTEEHAGIEEQEDLEAASGLAFQFSMLGLDHTERGNLANHMGEEYYV